MIQGSCHCGATRFILRTAPADVTHCTCSLCAKKGALWSYYMPDEVEFLACDDALYTWQSNTVKHHHCPKCGCSTYSESPVWENGKRDMERWRYGFNVRLLDDFDIESLPVIEVDGRNGNWYADLKDADPALPSKEETGDE